MLYKGMDCVEVLSGKAGFEVSVDFVNGMYNSVSCKKSRNRNNEEVVRECEEILGMISEWKMKNGIVKSVGKRGKYDDVDIESLSDEVLGDMYECLYSRVWYYKGVGNKKKLEELEGRLDEVKMEKKRRNMVKIMEEMK